MQIYLPIAELSINVFIILGMGGMVGFLSGMFGVGGGFLMTPLLIFSGVPPVVAVATEANQIVGASVSGALAHWRRGAIDFKMGAVLLVGGALGSFAGVWLFKLLRDIGQVDLLISLCYVVFLGSVGSLMIVESVGALLRRRRQEHRRRKAHKHTWVHGLPFRLRFHKSKLYISVIPPLMIGFIVGVLAAIMGVGGGFIMVPAMIYLLGMPTAVVIGTSLFQIIFVTAIVTLLHSVNSQTVDVLLALLLLASAVIGAQLGARAALKLRGEQLRAGLALMVLAMCAKLAYGLIAEPTELFIVAPLLASGP
ncbi:MAG: sulfite exporter TauE/SafE family protein [Sphingomonadales bacterium]